MKQNAVAQLQPRGVKRSKIKTKARHIDDDRSEDAKAFYAAVDAPSLRVCGSCGELTKSEHAVMKRFEPDADLFSPLFSSAGECEIIPEALVNDENCRTSMIWLCRRCETYLRKKEVPKFCRANGFRLAPVPHELAVLNRLEARLIGLGVSFTTCVNLYCDGQEFTRGNSINYWNSAVEVVLDLPRSLHKCGVVFLKTKTTESARLFRVRPDLLRRALCWLIENNPLYTNVRISEENLAALHHFDVANDIPNVSITDEEVQQLRIHENQLNREPD
ncbi:hypothetical protein PC120_g10578 [Phytophthora cactorum]|nr:hypothetical protein PC120_g10578 [Phytophthora cactorum]